MRWPFVTRNTYELLERENNRLFTRLQLADIRADRLEDSLMDLVTPKPEPLPPPPPAEPTLPSEVIEALDFVGLSGSVRANMTAWAYRALERGKKPAEVAEAIQGGGLREVARSA